MIGFLVGLLFGLLVATIFWVWGTVGLLLKDLNEAQETIKTCNELLESIEDHVIEVKVES